MFALSLPPRSRQPLWRQVGGTHLCLVTVYVQGKGRLVEVYAATEVRGPFPNTRPTEFPFSSRLRCLRCGAVSEWWSTWSGTRPARLRTQRPSPRRSPGPAGGIEPGEGLEAAAIRDVAEETGVTPADVTNRSARSPRRSRPARHEPLLPSRCAARVTGGVATVFTGHGDDADLVFVCRFDPNPVLWPVQAVFRT